MKKIVLLAGLTIGAAGPAFAQPRCLELSQIYSFKALDDKTLIVEDNFHDKFRIGLLGYCPDLTFKEGLAFKSVGGTGLSCVTPGDDVISRDVGLGTLRCPVRTIEPYTAQMAKADADAAAAKTAAAQ